MIPRALEAEILRLYHTEHWPTGTIAAQLRVHHGTVRRVLAQAGVPVVQKTVRASMVEPYQAFIVETLAKYPTLRASRLYAMVRERGYPGAPDHFRAIIAQLRPRSAAEAYLRLRTLPREQAQVLAGLLTPDARRSSQFELYWPFVCETLEKFPTLPASRLYRIVRERGYSGGPDHFRYLIACRRPRFDAFGWMLAVLQKKIDGAELNRHMGDLPGLQVLLHRLYSGRLSDRNKSLQVLACRRGLTIDTICAFLGISTNTYSVYKRKFANGGTDALFAPKTHRKKSDDESVKSAIFKLLHEPPSTYGINRTTWTMPLLRKVLSEIGKPACAEVIRTITRAAGYRWRKARVVLTSTDPAYSEKLDRIHSILAGLRADDVFFSIDEYGPFAVKLHSGRKLVAPGEQPVVPQWQRSRGCLILTAALELSSNQITHFYSDKKNTAEMITMMDVLVDKYRDRRKIYLSWDAASWHISKRLNQRIEAHNGNALKNGGVVVETAPLPSGAQFLNVIESVFSGMSRAIIHSSNYLTLDDAKAAIDRHFKERNVHFQEHLQRAGKKIWGKEREPATFSDSSNCKDPRYR